MTKKRGMMDNTVKNQLKALFNKIVAGLAAQGWEQSRGINGCCAFRGKNGLKCAVVIVASLLLFLNLTRFA